LIAAGVRFGAGYPITPWSDIMELLRRELPKYGGTFVQTEDEIAAISMAIGASLRRPRGGDRFQRPGHFAQDRGARLGGHGGNAARHRGRAARRPFDRHADQHRAIRLEHRLSTAATAIPRASSSRPRTSKIVFTPAIEAVNIARKYSVPVIILTDQASPRASRRSRTEPRKSLPGHFARFHAGRRPQALRFVRPDGITHTSRPARASTAANIPSPPAWNTTNWAIRPARRNCTCR
jgi:2-oxoglutarate/2-oxoacid ferredoxin oxidoreductase subunit alpha